ncbi:MAG: hypothetical protein CMH56_03335 [Myxococcales bacterium]|nr:hypothetical protein [Myxococcales bacterium]
MNAPQSNSERWSKTDYRLAWILGLATFILGSLTGAASVGDADNAEFVMVALYGGVAHPPGYPLYAILLRSVGMLLEGAASPVWRLGLLSSASCGLAAVIFFFVLRRLHFSRWATALTVLWTFLSLPIWRMSNLVEPFALHVLLITAIVFCTQTLFEDFENTKKVVALGFLWGLAFCHHHTMVFMIPLVVWVLLSAKPDVRFWLGRVPKFLFGFGLGCFPLAYFFAHDMSGAFVWGDWAESGRLWNHLFRTEYGTFQLVPGTQDNQGRGLHALLKSLPEGWGYMGLLVLLLGVGRSMADRHQPIQTLWTRAFGVCLLVYLVLFLGMANLPSDDPNFTVVQRFLAQAYLLMGIFLAKGLDGLNDWYQKRSKRPTVMALLPVVLLLHVTQTFPKADRGNENFVQEHAQNILSLTEPGDVLITHNDLETFSLMYMNQKLGKKVTVIPLGMMGMPWFRHRILNQFDLQDEADDLKSMFEGLNAQTRLVWVEPSGFAQHSHAPERFYPLGPVFMVPRTGQEVPDPVAVFAQNKMRYDNDFVLPKPSDPVALTTRVERELFGKYGVPWAILCDSLKAMKAGSMHEACIWAKQFKGAP